jgi:hypothetical protein
MGLSVPYPAGRRQGRGGRWDSASCTPPAHRVMTGWYIPYHTELSMAQRQTGLRWDSASCAQPAQRLMTGMYIP